jgi:hypothetical protein
MIIKDKLKGVNPYPTPYNVSDQYPPEVQQRRRELIPKMLAARRDGKKATLVRDKLYINNKLYKPTSTISEDS